MLKERHRVFVSLLFAMDTAVVTAGVALAQLLDARLSNASTWTALDASHLREWLIATPIVLLCMLAFGLYKPRRDRSFAGELFELAKAVVVAWALIVVIQQITFTQNLTSRAASVEALALPISLFVCLSIYRFIFRLFLRTIRERGWNRRHMAIIGTGRLGQIAFRTLKNNSWTGIHCNYFISHHDTTNRTRLLDRPVRGGLDAIEEVLESHPVDGIILALPQSRAYLIPNILLKLAHSPVEVRIIPDVSPRYMPINLDVSQLEGMPILSVRQTPLNGYGAFLKRCLDLSIGSLALIFFGPIMIFIAAMIRITDGSPVFFHQWRVGMGGKPFKMYKFRTMRSAAAEQDVESANGTDAWTRRNDPRITPFGAWLRRFSLDELPQLINVIAGDMSLVGPRPERLDLMRHFRNDRRGYILRQNVKAGMTGWAQINGLRGDTSLRKRLQYDLYYVRNWSVLFDLRILLLTLVRGFSHPNAH